MSEKKRIDKPTGTETVGHEWDGIEELDTPMPRWWVFTFYATIIWAIGYVIVYPAIPMLNSATEGVFGWSSRGDYAMQVAEREKELEPKVPVLWVLWASMFGVTMGRDQGTHSLVSMWE